MSASRTVLCAHDFSETAALALEQATRLASRHAARLVLAHVVEPIPLGAYPAIRPPTSDLAIRGLAEEKVEEIASGLRATGFEVEVRVVLGQPGPELVVLAEEVAADLVVCGTRGLSGVKHLLLGSTAEHVVRRCPQPVLTVHPGDALLAEPISTVLVPTDLSGHAEVATRTFLDFFGPSERPKILLAYADQLPPYLEPFSHSVLEKTGQPDVIREDIEQRMQPIVESLVAVGFAVETFVVDGEPADAIPELAAKEGAELIVMSTHGRSALVNALLGRTAQRIVQRAECPVLTVRARSHENVKD